MYVCFVFVCVCVCVLHTCIIRRYYCIAELVEQLEEQLERLRDDYHKICRVPVITSLDEETRIVSTSMKVYTTMALSVPCVMSLT